MNPTELADMNSLLQIPPMQQSERYTSFFHIFPCSSAREPLDLKPSFLQVPPIPSTKYGFPRVMLSLNVYIQNLTESQTKHIFCCSLQKNTEAGDALYAVT